MNLVSDQDCLKCVPLKIDLTIEVEKVEKENRYETVIINSDWNSVLEVEEEGRFGPIKLVQPRHFLLKCLYLARKVSGHVFVCKG